MCGQSTGELKGDCVGKEIRNGIKFGGCFFFFFLSISASFLLYASVEDICVHRIS